MKHIYILTLFVGLLAIASLTAQAQIGGKDSPLQYSQHTYSIEKGSTAYTSVWGVYPDGTTDEMIENGTAVPLSEAVYKYTTTSRVPAPGTWAYFDVQFSGTAEGTYVIGYKETTGGLACVTAETFKINVRGIFDVDVVLVGDDANCPGGSGQLLAGVPASTTTVDYTVKINYPGLAESGYIHLIETWNFDFQVTTNGASGGTDATIVSAEASGAGGYTRTWTASAVGLSDYTGNVTVNPTDLTPITFRVVYNDVLGVDQSVQFRIFNILGYYKERDKDELFPLNADAEKNTVTHTIYGLPNVGQISAWN